MGSGRACAETKTRSRITPDPVGNRSQLPYALIVTTGRTDPLFENSTVQNFV